MNCGTRLIAGGPGVPSPGYGSPWPTGYPGGYATYPYGRSLHGAKAGDILSAAFQVWSKSIANFFVVYLVLALITGVIGAVLSFAIVGSFPTGNGVIAGSPTSLAGIDIVRLVVYIVAAAVASVIVSSVVLGGMTEYAVRRFRGESMTVDQAIRRGIQKFLSILGASILLTLIVVALIVVPLALLLAIVVTVGTGGTPTGALAAIGGILIGLLVAGILAVYVYIALSLYPAAIMMENAHAVEGLSRSWALTRGHRLSLFGAILVVAILTSVVTGFIMFPASRVGNPIVSLVATVLASAIVGPWTVILIAVAYDLIARQPTYPPTAPPYFGAPPPVPPPVPPSTGP